MAPRHVSLILDGNRRSGAKQGLKKLMTYRRGANNARNIAKLLFKKGTSEVSLWAGSGSNLAGSEASAGRSEGDIDIFFNLLSQEMKKRLRRKNEKVAFRLCGAWGEYTSDRSFHELVETLEKDTAHHEHRLTVLFGYNGDWDIEQAAQSLYRQGTFPTMELLRKALWTGHLPDANMIVRTGVDHLHDSDSYLPHQRKGAYLYNTPTLWPDFGEDELNYALDLYAAYKPRNGG